MSGQIKQTTTVNSGTTNVNLLTGLKQEFLSRPAAVKVYAVQDLVAASNLEITPTLGNVVVGEDLVPNIPGANLGPRTNEDIVAGGVGLGGDRIQIRVRETTGGVGANGIIRTLVDIVDL